MREYWSYCGEIEDMDLMRFPDTNRFKGIAFITFVDVTPPPPPIGGFQWAFNIHLLSETVSRLNVGFCSRQSSI